MPRNENYDANSGPRGEFVWGSCGKNSGVICFVGKQSDIYDGAETLRKDSAHRVGVVTDICR